jgi:hypothetical protein
MPCRPPDTTVGLLKSASGPTRTTLLGVALGAVAASVLDTAVMELLLFAWRGLPVRRSIARALRTTIRRMSQPRGDSYAILPMPHRVRGGKINARRTAAAADPIQERK